MRLFSLDTSAFIEPWRRLYPIDVFPSFWQELTSWGEQGRIIAPEEVLAELEKIDDDLHAWAKERRFLFKPPEIPVQRAVKAILSTHPQLVDTRRQRSMGDPWVIALAQVTSATVVTEERRSGSRSGPKIPDVCDDLQIPHTNVLGLIRQMNLTF